MQIAVSGSGYVGLVAAACFAELGHKVVCVDNDLEKIEILNSGGSLIHEDYLQELLSRHRGANLLLRLAHRGRSQCSGSCHRGGHTRFAQWRSRTLLSPIRHPRPPPDRRPPKTVWGKTH